jgi:hypothetical protein
MPVCAGKDETGICPNNISDNTVKWSVCDLWLCSECYDYRMPSTVLLSDNKVSVNSAGVADITMNGIVAPVSRKLIVNEVLFFACGKFSVTTGNKLKLVLNSFFTDDEIAAAKEQLHTAVLKCNATGVPRHVKRQGGNRLKLNTDDLLKLLTISDEQKLMDSLPLFVAGNINRVPSVNMDDVDLFVLAKKLDAFESRLLNIEGQQNVGVTSTSLNQTAHSTSMVTVSGQRSGNQTVFVQSPASSPDNAVVVAAPSCWALASSSKVLRSNSSSASMDHSAGMSLIKPDLVVMPINCSVGLGDQLGFVQPLESTVSPPGLATVMKSTGSSSVMVTAQHTVSPNDPVELSLQSVSSVSPLEQSVESSSIQSGLAVAQQSVHRLSAPGIRTAELTSVSSGPEEVINSDGGDWQTKKPRKSKCTRIRGTGTADVQQSLLRSGVDLIKKRVFHIDNLHVDTTVNDVNTFLTEHGVCVLSCFQVKSWLYRRENASVTSMRVCIRAGDSGKMLKSSLWPKSIIVRDWKFLKLTEDGR